MSHNSEEKVFYLFSAIDDKGLFRCYFDRVKQAAFTLSPKPLLPLAPQLVDDLLSRFPDLTRPRIHFVTFFNEVLEPGEKLYLLLYDQPFSEVSGALWPDFLKSLEKDRRRLAFMKAFQVVMGLHKENIKAIHPEDLKPPL